MLLLPHSPSPQLRRLREKERWLERLITLVITMGGNMTVDTGFTRGDCDRGILAPVTLRERKRCNQWVARAGLTARQ